MKPKTLIILLILLAVCVGFVALMKMHQAVTKTTDKPKPRGVLIPQPGKIVSLNIAAADGKTIAFARKNASESWQMQAPASFAVRQNMVDSLAEKLANMKYVRKFEPNAKEGLDDSLTSLDKPLWTVTLGDATGRSYTLLIGQAAVQIGRSTPETYARLKGQPATLVVAENLAALLDRQPSSYREMTVLAVEPKNATSLTIAGREQYTLTKTSAGWQIDKPLKMPADNRAVQNLLAKFRGIQTRRFLAEKAKDLAPFGLDKPLATITIATAKTSQKLLLGSQRGKNLCAKLADKPAIFLLDASLLSQLQPTAESLQSRQIIAFNPTKITKIDVTNDAKNISLAKGKKNKWSVAKPAGPASLIAIDGLLRAMYDLRATSWIAAGGKGGIDIANPQAKITLTSKGWKKPRTLLIGGKDVTGKQTYVKLAGANVIASVPTSAVRPLLAPVDHYQAPASQKSPAARPTKTK